MLKKLPNINSFLYIVYRQQFLEQIDRREPFASYGLASIEAVYLVGKLEDWLGIALDATLLWDHPTIDALAAHLAKVTK